MGGTKMMMNDGSNHSDSKSHQDEDHHSQSSHGYANAQHDVTAASTPVARALRHSILQKQRRRSTTDMSRLDSHTAKSTSLLPVSEHEVLGSTSSNNGEAGKRELAPRMNTTLHVISENNAHDDYESDDEEDEDDDSLESFANDDSVEMSSPLPQPVHRATTMLLNMRRRSALQLLHDAAFGFHLQSETQMTLVQQQLQNTYLLEGDSVLLHGYLHIQIIRAKRLRNSHWKCRGGLLMCKCRSIVVSPSVTVHAGANRLLKTPAILNDANPEWNLDFFVPVCHPIEKLEFRVQDRSDLLGTTFLPVHELIRFGGEYDDNEESESSSASLSASHASYVPNNIHSIQKKFILRTGVRKTVHLDNRPHHGSLEYSVEFIPKRLLHDPPKNRGLLTRKSAMSMVVPGVYFPVRTGNRLRLYINADDKGKQHGRPPVRYGKRGNSLAESKTWKGYRFFRDVYDSICQARHMIYIVGWSVDHTVSLLRGEEQTKGLNQREHGSHYSPYIGELLNQKADEGVSVNMLVWDDMTSNALISEGVVATRDEELRHYFRGSKVHLRLVPMASGNANILKQFRMSVYYTHHQKCVIADTLDNDLVAFVGGIDLTYGRYEDGSYPLFRSLQTDHKDDFHNACAHVTQSTGPREPWHDIHARIRGPGTLDLVRNFEERWVGQGGVVADLVSLEDKGISASPTNTESANEDDEDGEAWSTQLYRSIDSTTAKLSVPDFKTTNFSDVAGVKFEQKEKIKATKRMNLLENILQTGAESQQFFVASTADNIQVARPLDLVRDIQVDSSAHKAMIHHIRNAQHSIYIESQYFLSSSFLWPENKTAKCCNLVAAEITWKICEKIEAGQRFAAYIVVPMWPEGMPDSTSVQDILWYQSLTMKSMYRRIQQAIDRRRKNLESEGGVLANSFADITPRDYLNFYCLANRETAEGGQDVDGRGLLNQTRRHLVYTHSKMTIVDDAVILVGSANINQRSLDGNRDSELLLGAWQPNHLATEESVPDGDVHGFRMCCFAHVTGTMVDAFRDPSSLECVRQVNDIARENWSKYTQEEVCEMTSYLVPFPVKILAKGDLAPMTENGYFPDTESNILGSRGTLPKYLTT